MEISGAGRNYAAYASNRHAVSQSAEGTVQADKQANAVEEQYDRLVHGLTTLRQATEDAEAEAKARAKHKLKDAKEQLKFLQRWGFEPEVLARQAALLGVVVAAAAREFAQALTEGGAAASLGQSATTAAIDMAASGAPQDAETSGDEKPGSPSQAEQAYMDVMDDDEPRQTSRLSPEDIQTAMEFTTIARQIKALLEQAARRLREQNAAATLPGTQSLDTAVNSLAGAVSAMPVASITI